MQEKARGVTGFFIAFIVCYIGSLVLVTRGAFDIVIWAAIPIIFGAESIIFAMLYASMYHGDVHPNS